MTSLALQRGVFMSNEQYLEAATDLANEKRLSLGRLFATDASPEDKATLAAMAVMSWGAELDELWARRLAGTDVKP
jgi:hypothetical protein